MRNAFRKNTVIAAAVLATGAVALAAPGMSKGLFDAQNAHKVDGYHAKELIKTSYYAGNVVFDNFDTCTFTTIFSKPFATQKVGVVSVVSSVGAARDADSAEEGILTTRILIDGTVSSTPSSVNLENSGVLDGNSNNIGARKVNAGAHTVVIQAKECGPGMAFVYTESLTAQFSAFGAASSSPVLKPVAVHSLNR